MKGGLRQHSQGITWTTEEAVQHSKGITPVMLVRGLNQYGGGCSVLFGVIKLYDEEGTLKKT